MARLGSTELDVFPLCLGGNVFGWTIDEERSFAVLDAYAAAGGNFIDTADIYGRRGGGPGASEQIIGRWIAARGNRDGLVIATVILGAISYRAAWTRRRSTVPGPVVGNESKPLSQRIGDVGAVENARAWRPMHDEDGLAVRIAGFFGAEETATRRTNQPLHAA